MKNWKTTIAGALAIASAILGAYHVLPSEIAGPTIALLNGLGLILAKDHSATN